MPVGPGWFSGRQAPSQAHHERRRGGGGVVAPMRRLLPMRSGQIRSAMGCGHCWEPACYRCASLVLCLLPSDWAWLAPNRSVDVRDNVGMAAGASAGKSLCSLPKRQGSWCGPSAVAAMLSGGSSCRSAFCTEIALWNLGSLDCDQMTLFGQPFLKRLIWNWMAEGFCFCMGSYWVIFLI